MKKLLSRIRLKYRRSSLLLKCVVLATIVLSGAALLALRLRLTGVRGEAEALRQQAVELERENRQLEQRIAELGTVKSLRQIAGEELGLVDPDSQFFTAQEVTNP